LTYISFVGTVGFLGTAWFLKTRVSFSRQRLSSDIPKLWPAAA